MPLKNYKFLGVSLHKYLSENEGCITRKIVE